MFILLLAALLLLLLGWNIYYRRHWYRQVDVTGHPEHKEKQKKRGTGDAHHVMPWRRENLSGL